MKKGGLVILLCVVLILTACGDNNRPAQSPGQIVPGGVLGPSGPSPGPNSQRSELAPTLNDILIQQTPSSTTGPIYDVHDSPIPLGCASVSVINQGLEGKPHSPSPAYRVALEDIARQGGLTPTSPAIRNQVFPVVEDILDQFNIPRKSSRDTAITFGGSGSAVPGRIYIPRDSSGPLIASHEITHVIVGNAMARSPQENERITIGTEWMFTQRLKAELPQVGSKLEKQFWSFREDKTIGKAGSQNFAHWKAMKWLLTNAGGVDDSQITPQNFRQLWDKHVTYNDVGRVLSQDAGGGRSRPPIGRRIPAFSPDPVYYPDGVIFD